MSDFNLTLVVLDDDLHQLLRVTVGEVALISAISLPPSDTRKRLRSRRSSVWWARREVWSSL